MSREDKLGIIIRGIYLNSKCNPQNKNIDELVDYVIKQINKIYAREKEGVCSWGGDEENNYETSCGHMFCITEGTPRENKMKYCCYCGKKLKQYKIYK